MIAIDRVAKEVEVKNLLSGEIYRESYDKLILSPGAQPIKPNLLTVVGAGFIGIETIENLIEAGYSVTLVQSPNQVLKQFDDDLVQIMHKELIDNGVNLILGDRVEAFEKDEVILKSGRRFKSEVIVFGIGVTPDSILAKKAGLKLGKRDTIWVDHNYKTSDPDIYAVGDAIQVYNPLVLLEM